MTATDPRSPPSPRAPKQAALREALDQAAKNPELAPLVRVVKSLRASA